MQEQLSAEEIAQLRTWAREGDVGLQYKLGSLFKVMPQLGDPGESVRWLEAAAAGGSVDACWELAEAWLRGISVAPDLERAHTWLARGAARGHLGCKYQLAVCLANGTGIAQDLDAARALGMQVAGAGDPRGLALASEIQARLGSQGPVSVTLNVTPGEFLRRLMNAQAAAQCTEPPRAPAAAPRMVPPPLPAWARGPGVTTAAPPKPVESRAEPDPTVLADRAAAEAGDPEAALRLYARAVKGTEGESAEAIRWLARAAAGGQGHAMYVFARRYADGRITATQVPQAAAVFARCQELYPDFTDPALPAPSLATLLAAANRGDARAAYLAAMRLLGEDASEADQTQGIRLLAKATQLGLAAAQFELARRQGVGEGVPLDRAGGKALALLAVKQGHGPARMMLETLFRDA